jgi:formiminoglutamase
VSTTTELWPRASALLTQAVTGKPVLASLVGVSTYATSVTPRSALSTPVAIRQALERFSTWSYRDQLDLLAHVEVLDLGDVADPDGLGGEDRVADALAAVPASSALTLVLGGDNAATWLCLRALMTQQPWGLITLDAHLDMREGRSNGSPVRQLLAEGLSGAHVVQVGLSDFANSAHYAAAAAQSGAHAITRHAVRERGVAAVAEEALAIAGATGRRIYVDLDVDVVDRAAVPGCPASVPGGLSADELREFAYVLAQDPRVGVIDITEIDVARDSADERTVRLGALLVLEALAGRVRKTQ